jgi:peroxin-11B
MEKAKWKQRRLRGKRTQEVLRIELMTNRQRTAANIQLISDICDLTVPGSALGYVNLDDGIVGLAGTVSSLIGVYSVWQKTA